MTLTRKILYSLVPLGVVGLAATAALTLLESRELVDTTRDADVILHLDEGTLVRQGDRWLLYDPQRRDVVQFEAAVDKGDTFRIVLTGGSFVRGDHNIAPGEPPSGFGDLSSWTEALLRARLDADVEVLNAGASGQSSTRVRKLVEGLVELDPDVLVVATGNNEGMVTSPHTELMHDWIVYRGLKKALLPEPPPEERPPVIVAQSPRAPLTQQHERNLRMISATATRSEVPLVLATLPANWTTAQKYMPEDAFDEAARRGWQLCWWRRYDEAMEHFAASETTWGALQYSAACMRRRGELEEARARYIAATEFQSWGRTPQSLNANVAKVAGARHPVADLAAAMEALSDDGLPGDEYFIDTAHLSVDGYYEMARVLVASLDEAGLLPGPLGPEPSQDELAAAEGWTEALAEQRRQGF